MSQQPTNHPDLVYVSFSAEINPLTTEGLLGVCCDLATKGTKIIYLLLSTPGGSVMHGITVFNVLRALPTKIVTHNVGVVNSIGNVVFLAGEERYANPGTTFMFHGVGFDVQQIRLEEKNLRELNESLKADQGKIGGIIKSRARFSDDTEVGNLFLEAATRDTAFAQDRGIIHDVREAKVPNGAPIVQLVFKR